MIDEHMIQTFINDLSKWSDSAFGKERPFTAPLHHLKLEIDEVIESDGDPEEFADCFLLLLDSYRKTGGNTQKLMQQMYKKLEINKQREWNKPTENGVFLHKK